MKPFSRSLSSWLCKYPCYKQNYLSILSSNKWSILCDPDDLAIQLLAAQNPGLLVVDLHDEKLIPILKQAVVKGTEVVVKNFEPGYDTRLKVSERIDQNIKMRELEKLLQNQFRFQDLFERRLTEHIHAFVGLVGIPVMRKDMRVVIAGEEIILHNKFFLQLHTANENLMRGDDGELAKYFNLVQFDYNSDALEKNLLEMAMKSAQFEEAEK